MAKTNIGLDQDVLKTSSEDVWVRRIYSSWSSRFEEDKRRLQTSSSRRMFAELYLTKMFNLDEMTNENNNEHNEKWPFIPDHPYRILITGGSGSGKTNALLN